MAAKLKEVKDKWDFHDDLDCTWVRKKAAHLRCAVGDKAGISVVQPGDVAFLLSLARGPC